MGMAASQARLLSITARLADNEYSGQSISYAKVDLANKTEEVNTEYLDALNATKLTVLTGFNDSEEVYSDISYSLLTGYNTVATGTQYIVTNTDGEVLVTQEQAEAFEAGNGDFNVFLAELGYSQSDITVTEETADEEEAAEAYQKIHEAWDQYLTSVGLSYEDDEHGLSFGYETLEDGTGYVTYTVTSLVDGEEEVSNEPLNYEGTTQEQRDLYDYAVALTAAYYGGAAENLKTADDSDNASYISYLQNLFQKMLTSGYYTEDDESATIYDNSWFEEQLMDGTLLLEYYSAVDGEFVSTSIDSDSAIQEVTDERELALIEIEYEMELEELEQKDNQYDLELSRLDTEHNALQTEYDSVKNVIDKNLETSFQTFS